MWNQYIQQREQQNQMQRDALDDLSPPFVVCSYDSLSWPLHIDLASTDCCAGTCNAYHITFLQSKFCQFKGKFYTAVFFVRLCVVERSRCVKCGRECASFHSLSYYCGKPSLLLRNDAFGGRGNPSSPGPPNASLPIGEGSNSIQLPTGSPVPPHSRWPLIRWLTAA